jgi:hypothetical protein
LLVATTDLDESETVVSNLGSIAVTGGKSARTLFRDLLVASSSILGAFEPVITSVRDADGVAYQALHVVREGFGVAGLSARNPCPA